MRKLPFVIGLVGALVLSGCGGGGSDQTTADGKKKIVVSISSKIEAFAPLLLGIEKGEFAKENLDVQVVTAKFEDGLVLASTGRADVVPGQPSAASFNAVAGGSDIRYVGPGLTQPSGSRQGVWVSNKFLAGRKYEPEMLKGQAVASVVGPGSVSTVVMNEEMTKAGLTLNDIKLKKLPPADIVTALRNGAVQAGWLVDPIWAEAAKGDFATFAFGQRPGDSLGGMFYGKRLLREDRAAGEAFMRAWARTVRTYLQGDYHKDPDVSAALAKALDSSSDQLRQVPSPVFDPELTIAPNLVDRLQKAYRITPGLLQYDKPLTTEQYIDSGFIEAAPGAGQ